MSVYCDVALPVPLDRAFTYELRGLLVEVGARVLVRVFVGVRVGVNVGDLNVGGGVAATQICRQAASRGRSPDSRRPIARSRHQRFEG